MIDSILNGNYKVDMTGWTEKEQEDYIERMKLLCDVMGLEATMGLDTGLKF